MDEATLLYRVRKTVLQMLRDRGYIISSNQLSQSKEDFKAGYNLNRESLNMLVRKKTNEQDNYLGEDANKLLVFFPETDKLNNKDLTQISLKMIDVNVLHAIIVIKGSTILTRKVS